MKLKKLRTIWLFPAIVLVFYIITGFTSPVTIAPSLQFSLKIILVVLPVFVIVFALMALFNYYIHPKTIQKYLGSSSGAKKWVIAIVGGIISTGPLYMWYPMLKELRKRGVNQGFISVFLYNRAIKIHILPIMVFYFGFEFTVILTFVMIFLSVIMGIFFEWMEKTGFV